MTVTVCEVLSHGLSQLRHCNQSNGRKTVTNLYFSLFIRLWNHSTAEQPDIVVLSLLHALHKTVKLVRCLSDKHLMSQICVIVRDFMNELVKYQKTMIWQLYFKVVRSILKYTHVKLDDMASADEVLLSSEFFSNWALQFMRSDHNHKVSVFSFSQELSSLSGKSPFTY